MSPPTLFCNKVLPPVIGCVCVCGGGAGVENPGILAPSPPSLAESWGRTQLSGPRARFPPKAGKAGWVGGGLYIASPLSMVPGASGPRWGGTVLGNGTQQGYPSFLGNRGNISISLATKTPSVTSCWSPSFRGGGVGQREHSRGFVVSLVTGPAPPPCIAGNPLPLETGTHTV